LKQGATLNTKILDKDDPRILELIELTCKEQDKVLALKKIDWEKMNNTYVTI
jgi:hypothetical protein